MATQTPTAKALSERLNKILNAGANFIEQDLQARLQSLRPKDIDALNPPSVMAAGGIWINDAGFCRRLGAWLFDVSDETVEELSARDYQILQAAVAANFTRYMELGTP